MIPGEDAGGEKTPEAPGAARHGVADAGEDHAQALGLGEDAVAAVLLRIADEDGHGGPTRARGLALQATVVG